MARMASGMAASSLARHSVAGETVGEPRELLRALFQSSTVGVAICDRQFRFRAINDALAAMTAFLLGLVQLAAPKGTLPHRTLGWIWVGLMVSVALSSFWIHQIRLIGLWSPIHLLSIFTLVTLPLGVWMATRLRTRVCHRRAAIEPRTNRGVAVKGRNRSLESKLLPHQGSHWPGSGGRRHCFGAHKT